MKRLSFFLGALVLALTGAACREECPGGASCALPQVSVVIGTAPNHASFTVEIAATPKARAQGLMNRPSIAPDAGMLFLFPSPTRAGFWMKNTLVDLDIAFILGDRVVDVRQMTSCRADPCPLTRPSANYDKALETAGGALASVKPGDRVEVQGDLPESS